MPIHLRTTHFVRLALCLSLVCIFCSASSTEDVTELTPPSQSPIPETLFGLHIHRADSTSPWPTVPFGSWRLWDAYVDWAHVEPQRGKFDFQRLDKDLDLAQKHNVDVLLTMALTPAWASARPQEKSGFGPGMAAEPVDLDDWRAYIRAVATHCKGRVHDYEIWNEPNLKIFYTGDVGRLVTLTREAYKILKQVDPSNEVVSPSPTGPPGVQWLAQFLAQGGGKYIDVIGYHFYVTPLPPEELISRVEAVRRVMSQYGYADKPLWNTETGWLVQDRQVEVRASTGSFSKVLSEPEASAYVARSYVLAWALGISRFYWYDWDGAQMGFTDADGKTVKTNAASYANVEKWLVGARMTSCSHSSTNLWICVLQRPGEYTGRIYWNPDQSFELKIPVSSPLHDAEFLDGHVQRGISEVRISGEPVLLENKVLTAQSSSEPVRLTESPSTGLRVVPEGTSITVRTIDPLGSDVNTTGDIFTGSVDSPVVIDGVTVIPKGTKVQGNVADSKSAGHFAGRARLSLVLTTMTMNQKSYSLTTGEFTKEAGSRGERTAEVVGGGAALGALIGGLADGGKGAAIGAGAGGAAGVGIQAATKAAEVRLPSESLLEFKLQAPLTIMAPN